MGIIRLKNMQFFGYHGVYDHEKEVGAPFEVDIEIETSFAHAIKSDDINETVNYDNIFKLVNSIVSNKRFNFKIEKVLVRVRKPKVQISGVLDTVEVEIEKSK
jgi:dihydroneopterin aldolase